MSNPTPNDMVPTPFGFKVRYPQEMAFLVFLARIAGEERKFQKFDFEVTAYEYKGRLYVVELRKLESPS